MATAAPGLVVPFFHQMGAAADEGCDRWPHLMARLDRPAGQESFRQEAAATTDTARRYSPTCVVNHHLGGSRERRGDPGHHWWSTTPTTH